MLEIANLSKSFRGPDGRVQALEDVSLKVASGEFVAVQGPSGCGKTTLLLSAGGLQEPDGGGVFVNGRNIYELSAEERARLRAEQIGFVFQQFHLVPYLSVLDNVLAPSIATSDGNARERAEELVEYFQLTDRVHHVPSELSTGERQRTALARALLNRPKLLLADEPTGNLDKENSWIVLGYLKEFSDAGGAVLLVTHDPQAAEVYGRTLRFVGGRLVSG